MANPAPVHRIQHVALDVADLAAAIEFYEHLGLAPVDRPGSLGANGIWLGVGDAQLHLVERPDLDEVSSGSHVAFEVQDLEGTAAALRDLGIEVGDPFDIGAGLQAFLRDPSGNLVELNQPTG